MAAWSGLMGARAGGFGSQKAAGFSWPAIASRGTTTAQSPYRRCA